MEDAIYVRPISPLTPDEIRAVYEIHCYKTAFFKLVEICFVGRPDAIALIQKAYNWNYDLFIKKRRRTGGFTMTQHLVPVAVILMQIYQVRNPDIIAAALTHDTVEDIPGITLKRVKTVLNAKVAYLVEGLTEPLKSQFDASVEGIRAHQTAKFAKVHSFGQEAVLIKTAGDRLQNILTLDGNDEYKQLKLIETEEFVIPLAEKFNLPVAELKLAIAEQKSIITANQTT